MFVISLFLFVTLELNLNAQDIKRISIFKNIRGLESVSLFEREDTFYLELKTRTFFKGEKTLLFPITPTEAQEIIDYVKNPDKQNPLYLFKGVVLRRNEVESYNGYTYRVGLPVFLYGTFLFGLPYNTGAPLSLLLGYLIGKKFDFNESVRRFWSKNKRVRKYDVFLSLYSKVLLPKRSEFLKGYRWEGSPNLEAGINVRVFFSKILSSGLRFYNFDVLSTKKTLRGDAVGFLHLKGYIFEGENRISVVPITEEASIGVYYTLGIGSGDIKTLFAWGSGEKREDVNLYSYSIGFDFQSPVKRFKDIFYVVSLDYNQMGVYKGESIFNYKRERPLISIYRLRLELGHAF